MLEFVFDVIFAVVAIRAIWKLFEGIKAGMSVRTVDQATRGRESGAAPASGVQMAKDPVCGTYVVPDNALSVKIGGQTVYFCSAACRDKFRAKTA